MFEKKVMGYPAKAVGKYFKKKSSEKRDHNLKLRHIAKKKKDSYQ